MSDEPQDDNRKPLRVREAALQRGAPRSIEQWVTAGEFKAQCLRFIDRINQQGGEYVVTRYGKPVARLVPYEPAPPSLIGHVAGSVLHYGDLISPIGEEWDADA